MELFQKAINNIPLRIFLVSLVILVLHFAVVNSDFFEFDAKGLDVALCNHLNLLAVLVINIAGTFSVRSMRKYPLRELILYALPFYLFWGLLVYAIFCIFDIPINLGFWLVCFIVVFIFKFLSVGLRPNKYKKTYGLISVGRASGLDTKVTQVSWEKLTNISDAKTKRYDCLVTDLHAKELNNDWEGFLAEQSLKGMSVFHFRHIAERLTGRVEIEHMYENYLGSLQPSQDYLIVKRLMDILLIIAAMPVILLVMLITAILIKIEDGGSIFFFQERVGRHNIPFTMYKFRSMKENVKTHTTQTNDNRITKIGKIIRKWRIDEFPQFFNVLKGDMSLIGPRAEFVDFANELNKEVPFYDYRHIVKPGMSGWAQVEHGYATGADESLIKVQHDFYYIKYISFHLDMIIILKTFQTVLTGFGSR